MKLLKNIPISVLFILKITFLISCSSIGYAQPKLVIPTGHTSKVNTAEFSPDGKLIVTASDDGTAK